MAGKRQTRTVPRQASIPDGTDAVGGGTTPKVDGGNDQHPIHDEDQEDRMPSDYEREIDRIDAATRTDR